jgi:L-2,4-diaminobutyrate transaminase
LTRWSPASAGWARCSARDHYGIKPDLITIAKGLTSAYAPLSGVIVAGRMWQVLVQGSDQSGADRPWLDLFGASDLRCGGVANLQLIDELDLVTKAGDIGAYFRGQLVDALAGHKNVGEVRGDGLLAAVEFVSDKDDRVFFDPAQKIGPQVSAALLERGVIGRAMPQGDILGFAPPFVLNRDQADIIVKATVGAVTAVLGA